MMRIALWLLVSMATGLASVVAFGAPPPGTDGLMDDLLFVQAHPTMMLVQEWLFGLGAVAIVGLLVTLLVVAVVRDPGSRGGDG